MEITTKKYYTCCLCGRTSTNEDKIKACEASHVGVYPETSIEETYGRNPRVPYPDIIRVVMQDGAIAAYNFVKIEPN